MGDRRLLCPKMMSVAGEEMGVEFPDQLKGLLQLLFAGSGKADAPVQVAAKAALEIPIVAAKAATRVFRFNMNASVQAGDAGRCSAEHRWPSPQQMAREQMKTGAIDRCRCFAA